MVEKTRVRSDSVAWQKSKLGVLPKETPSFGKVFLALSLSFITSFGFLLILLIMAAALREALPAPSGDVLCGFVAILAYLQAPVTTIIVALSLLRQDRFFAMKEDPTWK